MRAVEWRWIGGRLVVERSRVLAVEWRWRSSGGRTSCGGGEGGGEGDLGAVAVARVVELRWIGGGAVGGLVVVRSRVLVVEWRWCGGRMRVGRVAVAVMAVARVI